MFFAKFGDRKNYRPFTIHVFNLKLRDRSDSFLSMTVKCLGEKTSESFFTAEDACLKGNKTFKTFLKDS